MIGEYVIVRTRSAGVHCGTLKEQNGLSVLLADARRIWNWTGANTLHEMSLSGIGDGSRVSERVARILLTEAIEIIPCTNKSRSILDRSVWI